MKVPQRPKARAWFRKVGEGAMSANKQGKAAAAQGSSEAGVEELPGPHEGSPMQTSGRIAPTMVGGHNFRVYRNSLAMAEVGANGCSRRPKPADCFRKGAAT